MNHIHNLNHKIYQNKSIRTETNQNKSVRIEANQNMN